MFSSMSSRTTLPSLKAPTAMHYSLALEEGTGLGCSAEGEIGPSMSTEENSSKEEVILPSAGNIPLANNLINELQDMLVLEAISKMVVKNLKNKLGRRNLNNQGKKAELLSRLLSSVTSAREKSSLSSAAPDQLSTPTPT